MNPATFIHPHDHAPEQSFAQNARGRDLELKFLHAWRTVPGEETEGPKNWFVSVRDVSDKTDVNDHIDAYVTTRWGEIPIQIKSSELGRILFLRDYGHIEPKIAVVVVKQYFSSARIRSETFRAIRDHEVMKPYWLERIAQADQKKEQERRRSAPIDLFRHQRKREEEFRIQAFGGKKCP